MGVVAADGARVRLYRGKIQAHAGEDIRVSIVHVVIALIQPFPVCIEGIGVLHDELPGTQQSETRTVLVSVLHLDLIQVGRQLLIRSDVRPGDGREGLLVGRSQTEVSAVSVLDAPEFRSVFIPPAGFLPELCRHDGRHVDLLGTLHIHFFPDDFLDLPDRSPSLLHEDVQAGGLPPDQTGPEHQLVTRDHRLCRIVTERLEVHFR